MKTTAFAVENQLSSFGAKNTRPVARNDYSPISFLNVEIFGNELPIKAVANYQTGEIRSRDGKIIGRVLSAENVIGDHFD